MEIFFNRVTLGYGNLFIIIVKKDDFLSIYKR